MKLRNKVLISICIAWIAFLILSYFGSQVLLMSSFLALEKDRAHRDLGRIDQAVNQINSSLFSFTSDWSHWNDLYSYLYGQNPAFVPNNLNMTAFLNSNIHFLSYWNNQGEMKIGTAIDTDKQKLIAFPNGIQYYVHKGSILLPHLDVNHDIHGYVLTDAGIMLIASVAATDGEKLLKPRGTMIAGRWLDNKLIKHIADITSLSMQVLTLPQIKNNPQLNTVFDQVLKNKGHFSLPMTEDELHGYTLIRDIYHQPIGMFQMTTPRAIYLTGKKAVYYFMLSFLVLAVGFSILMHKLLGQLIIRRLEALNDQLTNLSKNKSIKDRVSSEGSDELSAVSCEINRMLTIIQASQDQLEHRVYERTQELNETNLVLQQEISERKAIEKELLSHKEHLAHLAHHDNLTTLPNRVFFNEILNQTIQHAEKDNKKFAVLFIDFDRFKNVNDALGHAIGDSLLKEMATRFQSVISKNEILARLGGDEFIMIAENIQSRDDASLVATKILSMTTKSVSIEQHEFYINASIGICVFPDDGRSLEDLQKNADIAMYRAKKNGGGIYQFYNKEMNSELNHYLETDAALRRALENNEFILYFQPQLSLQSNRIHRVEALLRWEDPALGMISPGKFIPIAEESGLIVAIGEWVFKKACLTLKKWHNQNYKLSMSINISCKQFRHENLVSSIQHIVHFAKVDPHFIELEITETAMMDDIDSAIKKLKLLKEMGFKISIDDFGTGYTSIGYLKQFPIDIIKIDQSFIRGITENPHDQTIVSAMIALGHSLNLEVVAEGVENAEQLKYLTEQKCDLIQGYFISRPIPESKVINLLNEKSAELENEYQSK